MTNTLLSHLWTSTLVLLVAWAIARFAPRLTARTRYAVLLAGIAKFAIPAAAFAPLANLFGGTRSDSVLIMTLVHGPVTAPVTIAGAASPRWPLVVAIVWASMAALVLLRALLLHRRTIAAALFGAVPGSAREVAALTRAKARVGVRQSVDLVRSPIAEAPAVLRIIRPVLVLPASSDALEDGELEAILAHECAHVARRDNAAGLFESLTGALLWFHPLLIIARRELARRREQACDEAVAEATGTEETYVSALTKVCRAAIAPRIAGVSCMASSQLKERMEHFMNYHDLKPRALSHRLVVAVAVLAIAFVTVGANVVDARDTTSRRYRLDYTVTPEPAGTYLIDFRVSDTKESKVVASNKLKVRPHERATAVSGTAQPGGDELVFQMEFSVAPLVHGLHAEGVLVVKENGRVLETSATTHEPKTAAPDSKFTGEKISINLKNADLQDVFKVLAQITGVNIMVPAGVKGTVDLNVVNTPWDQALDQICRDNNLTYRVEGNTIYITK